MKTGLKKIGLVFVGVILINILANRYNKRFDLTEDKRYSLSEISLDYLARIEDPALIEVYLEGDFPSEFNRLQSEVIQHLEELKAQNSNIQYRFIDPIDQSEELIKMGLQPSRLSVQEDGKVSEAIIFPWAVLSYNGKETNISLLSNDAINGQEAQLANSIEELEYEFTSAFDKVTSIKEKKIAVLKGNGELEDLKLASLLVELGQYYKLAPFTLDSVSKNPVQTLNRLKEFDLAIIAKPTITFSEAEKFTIDQFIMNGGKTLWTIDNTTAELDSLYGTGNNLVLNRDLNLTDLLFSYGVRINYTLIRDMYASTIRLADGSLGDQTQYQDYPWHFHPLITSTNNHPINKNIDPVVLKFAGSIDTIKNNLEKVILLKSSQFSKAVGTPYPLQLSDVEKNPIPENFNEGFQSLGVLLQGEIKSGYADRVKPFKISNFKAISSPSKMIFIADGDIMANEIYQGKPLPLNIDKFTNEKYGNMTFLLNSINYLLDDGLLDLRSKTLKIQFLDKQKAYAERTYWQVLNIVVPLVILGLFAILFNFFRRRKYR